MVSTVPYSAVARSIWEETGRRIVGGVILAGSCASVNALLQGVTRMMVSWSQEGLLPDWPRARMVVGLPVSLLLLAVSVGAMPLAAVSRNDATRCMLRIIDSFFRQPLRDEHRC